MTVFTNDPLVYYLGMWWYALVCDEDTETEDAPDPSGETAPESGGDPRVSAASPVLSILLDNSNT